VGAVALVILIVASTSSLFLPVRLNSCEPSVDAFQPSMLTLQLIATTRARTGIVPSAGDDGSIEDTTTVPSAWLEMPMPSGWLLSKRTLDVRATALAG